MGTKKNISRKFLYIILFFVTLGIAYAATILPNTLDEGYKIPEAEDNSGTNYQIMGDVGVAYEGGECIKVNNHKSGGGVDGFFSPTKTSTEWTGFKNWCNGTSDCSIETKKTGEVFSRVMDGAKHATCAITDNWGSGNGTSIKCWGQKTDDRNNSYSTESDGITPDLSSTHFYGNSNFNKNKVISIYGRCHYGGAIDSEGRLKLWAYREEDPVDKDHRVDMLKSSWDLNIPDGWDSDIKEIGVGAWFVCGVKKDGTARCWGADGGSGRGLGGLKCEYTEDNCSYTFNMTDVPTPSGWKVKTIGGSTEGLCVVYDDDSNNDTMRCRWRKGSSDDEKNRYDAIMANGEQTGIKKVEGASSSFCALKTDKTIKCWGDNSNITSGVPTDSGYVDLQTGQNHACALKDDGTVACWGHNNPIGCAKNGGIVNGANGKTNVKALGIGCYHSCLIFDDNHVECYGYNQHLDSSLNVVCYDENTGEGQVGKVPTFTPYEGAGLCTEDLFK